jgi:hypothetical protein
MSQDEWSVLYSRVRTPVYDRIKAAAAADERSVAKWIEIHFRDFFEKADRECNSVTSSPDTSPLLLDSDSSVSPPH